MNPHIRVDGQIGVEYVYVWKWKVLNPQRKICGFKNILILVDGARVSDKKKKKKKKQRKGDLTN